MHDGRVHDVRATRFGRADSARRVGTALVASAIGVVTATALTVGPVLLAPVLIGQFVRLLNLSARGFVWMVQAAENGWDIWAILAAIGRALGTAISAPSVALALVGLELVGVVALYVLRRLLRLEKESN